MITRTFIKKSNTIIKDSNDNLGLYPISMLHYGNLVSRVVLFFDIDKLKKEVDDKNYPNVNTLKHTLKMFNCGSVDSNAFSKILSPISDSGNRKRATSFDVIAFEIPEKWDMGVGFDTNGSFFIAGDASISEDGSTWFKAYNGKAWKNDDGIYSNKFLADECKKFINDEDSIIISRQHFDYGNEDLSLDITKFVNDIISGNKKNNGICLAFSPLLESTETEITNYVGFFNEKTNTIFQPCVETVCENVIHDNRFNFILGKENKLLLFCNLGGELTNLDYLPTCTIDGVEYPVKQLKKGVYEASVRIDKNKCGDKTILYDIWSNIVVDGEVFDEVEMEFVCNSHSSFYKFGSFNDKKKNYIPSFEGINDCEKMNQGEERCINVFFKVPYTNNEYCLPNKTFYRIYAVSGKREIDIIDWCEMDVIENFSTFIIKTSELLPCEYFIDIKAEDNGEVKVFKKVSTFEVVNNITKILK